MPCANRVIDCHLDLLHLLCSCRGRLQVQRLISSAFPNQIRLKHELRQTQFPVSLLVKRLQFNRVIPTITIAWGLVCMCNGFISNFAGLCVCRLVLGFLEGCLFPSLTLFMANWYLREELATRISYLFSEYHTWLSTTPMANKDSKVASALSGAFGGLIAFGILYMDGTAGYPGWRW
jgi:MFS family permease